MRKLLGFVFLMGLSSFLFAQEGNLTLSYVLEAPKEYSSRDQLEKYVQNLENRFIYFGFQRSLFEVNIKGKLIHVDLTQVEDIEKMLQQSTYTSAFSIHPVYKFDDEKTMSNLYLQLEGKSQAAFATLFEINSTTVPGYNYRRFPPAVLGMAEGKNIEAINKLLKASEIQSIIPPNARFIWSQKPSKLHEGKYDLYLVDFAEDRCLISHEISRINVLHEENRYGRVRDLLEIILNEKGKKVLTEITKKNIERELVILLDEEAISAPWVEGAIETGDLKIEGLFDGQETTALSKLIKTPPLKAELKVIEIK